MINTSNSVYAANFLATKNVPLLLEPLDETFFLGGIEKRRILEVFAPHIFFDDQRVHLDAAAGLVPSVHIPFGIKNETMDYNKVK